MGRFPPETEERRGMPPAVATWSRSADNGSSDSVAVLVFSYAV